MTYTIYADVLFLLNFIIDYFCLWATLYICKHRRQKSRLTLSAFVGGIYSVGSVELFGKPLLLRVIVNVLFLMIICTIATPTTDFKRILKAALVFLGVGFLCGGIITFIFNQQGKYAFYNGMIYADISPIMLMGLFLVSVVITIPFFTSLQKRVTTKTAWIISEFENGKISFDALVDSGNLLKDNISGDGIILVKGDALKEIFSQKQLMAIKNLNVLSEDFPKGIRLIPSEKGMIPIIRPRKITLCIFGRGKTEISAVIGFDFSSGTFGNTQGLLPSGYVED